MSFGSLEQQVIDADEAKRLMEHPLLKGAFEGVKAGIINAMQNAPMGDEKTHNRLVISLQVLNQIEKNITEKVQTGKLAEIQIQETLGAKIKKFARF